MEVVGVLPERRPDGQMEVVGVLPKRRQDLVEMIKYFSTLG